MNEEDSENFLVCLKKLDIQELKIKKKHIILFNTCCVRENAENKVFVARLLKI